MKKKFIFPIILAIATLFSCREDVMPQEETEYFPPISTTSTHGLYVLNEGIMNNNKASLDYCDYGTGVYHRNIYGQANPSVIMGLGDVGNDVKVYGSKLYVTLTNTGKVEIMDIKNNQRIKAISLKDARFITFHNGKVYVTAYTNKVGGLPDAPNGIVVEIDTTSLNITRTVDVGRQPEELCVVNNRIYVANSGGLSAPDYENKVSVIDISSFSVIENIEVAVNLKRIRKDQYGDIYVNSLGDYYDVAPSLSVIDTETNTIKKTFDIAVEDFWITGNTAYVIGLTYSQTSQQPTISYNIIDVQNETLLPNHFITDGTTSQIKLPTCVAVCPETKNIYICDAINYTVPGTLYCFNPQGQKLWSVTTGDIPAHITFVTK